MAVGSGFIRARPYELGTKLLRHRTTVELEDWLATVGTAMEKSNDVVTRFAGALHFALRGDERELAVGMCLLSGSRKSEKLAFAFETLRSGTQHTLTKMLRAVLAAVYCSTDVSIDTDMLEAIATEAAHLASAIVPDGKCTFDDFGNWYNSVGFESAPWLELLDLSKWPKTTPSGQPSRLIYKHTNSAPSSSSSNSSLSAKKQKKKLLQNNNSSRAAGDSSSKKTKPSPTKEDDDDEEEDEAQFLVTFDAETYPDDEPVGEAPDEVPGALKVQFTATAVARLRSFALGSGLFECEAGDVCTALLNAAQTEVSILGRGKRPALDMTAVMPIIAGLVGNRIKHPGLLRTLLVGFRVRVDPQLRDFVEAQDLAAAMTIFCAGSKSTKLAVAWDVISGADDGDDSSQHRLNARGLWRFVRAFLVVLLVLASCPVTDLEDDADDDDDDDKKEEDDLSFFPEDEGRRRRKADLSLDAITHLIDDADAAAVTLAARVFRDTQTKTDLSFDDFADWYTDGGFHLASWFELLDLYKWAL